ncbi:MAG: NlpC/P60 family protein [Pseudomonadales bacterium]
MQPSSRPQQKLQSQADSPAHSAQSAYNGKHHASSAAASSQREQRRQLEAHFRQWQGTPYRFGGGNREGIDCSGFVYVTFRDVFGVAMPRTTRQLAVRGMPVSKKQLAVGDLLFFKTGQRQSHVGIYMGEGKFIHASTSRGVMASSIHSAYWSGVFSQARSMRLTH